MEFASSRTLSWVTRIDPHLNNRLLVGEQRKQQTEHVVLQFNSATANTKTKLETCIGKIQRCLGSEGEVTESHESTHQIHATIQSTKAALRVLCCRLAQIEGVIAVGLDPLKTVNLEPRTPTKALETSTG